MIRSFLYFVLSSRLLLVVVLLSFSNLAGACGCYEPQSVKEAVRESKTVVIGTVLSREYLSKVESINDAELLSNSEDINTLTRKRVLIKYTLLVESMIKGKQKFDTLQIFSSITPKNCGVHFDIGTKYVIYGNSELRSIKKAKRRDLPKGKDVIWVDDCSRTRIYFEDEEQILKNL